MYTKTKNDTDYVLELFEVIFLLVLILILVVMKIPDANIITAVSALVGVAIPLYWQFKTNELKDNKGVEAYIKWCEVITNSNLTTVENDFIPWLEFIKNLNSKNLLDGDIQKFHSILRKNLDVKAYNEFLSSGLYYKLNDDDFKETLFYLVEVITKAEIIYSIQDFRIKKYQEDPVLLQISIDLHGHPVNGFLKELETRLEAINSHLQKLKKHIIKNKVDFRIPEQTKPPKP